MAGRPIGRRHQQDVRDKIKATQIINRLRSGFEGDVELTSTQVNIGIALLKKVLPDLSAIDMSGEVKQEVTFNVDATLRDL